MKKLLYSMSQVLIIVGIALLFVAGFAVQGNWTAGAITETFLAGLFVATVGCLIDRCVEEV